MLINFHICKKTEPKIKNNRFNLIIWLLLINSNIINSIYNIIKTNSIYNMYKFIINQREK